MPLRIDISDQGLGPRAIYEDSAPTRGSGGGLFSGKNLYYIIGAVALLIILMKKK